MHKWMDKMVDEVKIDMGDMLNDDGISTIREDRRAEHNTRWSRVVKHGMVSWLMSVSVTYDEYFRLDTKLKHHKVVRKFGAAGYAGRQDKGGDSDSDGDPRLISD